MPDVPERLKSALADRYAVDREIGRGGMAIVYLAEDLRHHRQVAIKVLDPALSVSLGADRFLNEIQIAARLDHPHIVPLHDSGTADGLLFYVMPYVAGESLRERLERDTQLPIEEALRIATEVADGLAYAHESGVVHRDIKPGNILLSAGHARIADFGVARAIDIAAGNKGTEPGLAVGTPVYMAPEQASGQERGDERSDIYSVGCLLYEMLVGEPPYTGLTPQTLLARKMSESAPRIRSVRDTVSPGVEDVAAKSIARIPADRYQTALDLKAALESPESAVSGQTARSSLASRHRREHPRWLLPVIIVVLLGLVSAGYVGLSVLGPGRGEAVDVSEIRSLAVLPLQNRSADPEQEFFTDGMTDRLTHVLGEISALTVISSMSAMRYKDSIKPLPEIARELGVDAFVEGAIMRAGEQVRITLRLVHGPTDTPVWSEEYVEEVGDVLDLQRRVSQDVAERIQLVLAPADLTRFAQPIDSPDPQAYEAYLRGRHHLIRWSGKDAATAILNFEEAIALDPAFAPAHAALAEICTLSRAFGPSSAYELEDCEDFVHRALALDPDHADAHYALGMVRSARWDWDGAETSFRRAIELNPNSAMARLWYGWFLSQLMRHDESLLESQRAESLDPLNPFVKVMVAQSLMDDHRYDEGLAKTSEALSLDPNYGVAHIMESAFYALKGMPREARESAQKAVNRMGEDYFFVLMLTAWSYAQEGQEDRAREILARIDALYAGPNAGVATVYLALGQEEEAFEILERAYLARSQWLPNWTVQPNFDSIRDQPRFQILRRNMGLER